MNEQVQEIFIEDIIPNRFQPRLTFDEKALQELSDSIKVHGVIQPLVLRRVGNKYEIIAGERRYKASCMAGLKKVPAIVREMTDNESAEVALIENVQRKNLSAIEEAQSYKNLLNRGYLTQEDLAEKLGVSQPTIANKLRLLNLCDEVQNALLNEQISERHARSLLAISNPDDQKTMLNRIIKERLTVKQLDNEIKKMQGGDVTSSVGEANSSVSEGNGGNVMNPVEENSSLGEEVKPIMEPNKNIFGFNIQTPTDLETSAPNLSVGMEETIPPVAFNPFGGDIISNIEVENDNSGSSSDLIIDTPSQNENVSSVGPVNEPIETFDMFGDVIKPTDSQPNASIQPFSFGGPANIPEAEPVQSKNIGDQINRVRDCIQGVETAGFRVEKEEYDFEDMYQIVIKIKK